MLACMLAGLTFTSSAQASEIRQILKNNKGWHINVTVRDAPTINGERIRIINTFQWPDTRPVTIELTGNTKNGWVKILYPTNTACNAHGRSHCRQIQGWILGEFVGITPARRDVIFKAPQQYVVIRDRVLGRLWHNVLASYHAHEWGSVGNDGTGLSRCCSYTFNKGDRITAWAQSGNWLAVYTINSKPHSKQLWIYHELVVPVH